MSVSVKPMTNGFAIFAALLGTSACLPKLEVPAQVADITLNESFTQTFLIDQAQSQKTETTYLSLVGPDAALALTQIRGAQAIGAKKGELEVRGDLRVTARIDPYDNTLFMVDGEGQFGVYTKGDAPEELLIVAKFLIGDAQAHAISGLRNKQLTLPIHHLARLNPTVLLQATRASKGEKGDKGDKGECLVGTSSPLPGEATVPCSAAGVGTPFPAEYYVRIHLMEVLAGKVYAIDRARRHEVFRQLPSGELDVFGCLELRQSYDDARQLDLRGAQLLTPLPRRSAELPPPASYDLWDLRESCPAEPLTEPTPERVTSPVVRSTTAG